MALTDFTGQIPLFFDSFLSKPASALPKGSLWVVDFEGLKTVRDAIIETAKLEPNNGWDVQSAITLYIDAAGDYNKKGCLFCQAVSIPGESTVVNPQGIQKNHYIMSSTGDGRVPTAPTGLRMVFLDTNVSFVDNIIRPWVVTTARLGLIARKNSNEQYRQNISVYKLGILSPTERPFILQKYTFYGACPTEVSSEEYNYSPTTAPINREVTFLFHTYKLETNVNGNNLAISRNSSPPDILKSTTKKTVANFTP